MANLDGHYWSPNGGLHVWLAYDTLARYDLKPQPKNKYAGVYTLNDSWAAMEPVSMLSAGASLNPKINNAGFSDEQYTRLTANAAAEPDAGTRKQLYSQLDDYILDQSFGIPVAPSTSRVVTKASVHGIEFRLNDVMSLGPVWIG